VYRPGRHTQNTRFPTRMKGWIFGIFNVHLTGLSFFSRFIVKIGRYVRGRGVPMGSGKRFFICGSATHGQKFTS
jgi:hypothetical protein